MEEGGKVGGLGGEKRAVEPVSFFVLKVQKLPYLYVPSASAVFLSGC